MRTISMINLALLLTAGLTLSACSNLTEGMNNSKSSIIEDLTPLQSNTVLEFDKKLGEIKDEETALEAVNFFATQVLSNTKSPEYKPKAGVGTNSISVNTIRVLSNENLLQRFARAEALVRNSKNGLSVKSLVEKGDLVTVAKLTDVMNSMEPVKSAGCFTEQEVAENQRLIRDNIPNLASNESTAMTPLEASVITYYALTGDDGSGSDDTQNLYATDKDLQTFTEIVLENTNGGN